MSRTTHLFTAAELAAMPRGDQRYELLEGVLVTMAPAGFRHGRIAGKLLRRIGEYVENHQLGETSAAETGFLIQQAPDTVRAPDVAFIAAQRLKPFGDHVGYLPLAPDLVAEVVSPNDPAAETESKVKLWLESGVRLVIVVDPQSSQVRVYRSQRSPEVYSAGLVDLTDVIPGLQLDVADLFA